MSDLQWGTLIIAVLGLSLSIFNTVVSYRRGIRRIDSNLEFKRDGAGRSRASISFTNMGHTPVVVTEAYLVGGLLGQNRWELVQFERGHREFPVKLEPGNPSTVIMLDADVVEDAAKNGAITLIVVTGHGTRTKGRSESLWELKRQETIRRFRAAGEPDD